VARRRLSRIDLAGWIVLLSIHVAAVRTLSTRTELIDRWGIVVVGIGVATIIAIATLATERVPRLIDWIRRDVAILVGAAGALWFGAQGWIPLTFVATIALGPAQILAILLVVVAIAEYLDELDDVDAEVWD